MDAKIERWSNAQVLSRVPSRADGLVSVQASFLAGTAAVVVVVLVADAAGGDDGGGGGCSCQRQRDEALADGRGERQRVVMGV